jgi:hypothetical protein
MSAGTSLLEKISVATFPSLCQRIERDFKGLRGIAIGNSQIAETL